MTGTPAQVKHRVLSWMLYITAGATRNLAMQLHFHGHHMSRRSHRAMDKAVQALDEAQQTLRDEHFHFKG